jgi:GH25 family lysozyme M1 (1,4-beta-N-acetylmuramidase)
MMPDPGFATNYNGAKAVNLPCGAIHMYWLKFGAVSQAELFSKVLRDNHFENQLPPGVHTPGENDKLNDAQLGQKFLACLIAVNKSTGHVPMICTWPIFIDEHMAKQRTELKKYPLWITYYASKNYKKPYPKLPSGSGWKWKIWKIAEQRIQGVSRPGGVIRANPNAFSWLDSDAKPSSQRPAG